MRRHVATKPGMLGCVPEAVIHALDGLTLPLDDISLPARFPASQVRDKLVR